jgi:hypothetical protein
LSLAPFNSELKSPTGILIGKSTPMSMSAKKRYQPDMAAAKPNAPLAYYTELMLATVNCARIHAAVRH